MCHTNDGVSYNNEREAREILRKALSVSSTDVEVAGEISPEINKIMESSSKSVDDDTNSLVFTEKQVKTLVTSIFDSVNRRIADRIVQDLIKGDVHHVPSSDVIKIYIEKQRDEIEAFLDKKAALDHTHNKDDIIDLPIVVNKNLLVNWYFANPVNRQGQKTYIGNIFGIDKWSFGQNTTNSMSIEDGYLHVHIANSGTLWQNFETSPFISGAQYTFSLLTKENQLLSATFNPNLTDQNLKVSQIDYNESILQIWNSYKRFLIHCNPDSADIDLVAVKLELGYEQTLAHQDADGNWILNEVPIYAEQYSICSQYDPITGEFVGNKFSNPNLLDNWYFMDPINQKNITSTTLSTQSYFIDRWRGNRVNIELTGDGISFAWTNGMDNGFIGQVTEIPFRELIDEKVTISAIVDDELYYCTYTVPSTRIEAIFSPVKNNIRLDFEITLDDSNTLVAVIRNFSHEPKVIKAMKFELGSVQTLAHKEGDSWVLNDPPPKKTLELLKCQTHQVVFNSGIDYQVVGTCFAASDTIAYGTIDIPVPLRSYAAGTITYAGDFVLTTKINEDRHDVTSIIKQSNMGSLTKFGVKVMSSNLVPGTCYALVSNANGLIVIDDNL